MTTTCKQPGDESHATSQAGRLQNQDRDQKIAASRRSDPDWRVWQARCALARLRSAQARKRQEQRKG